MRPVSIYAAHSMSDMGWESSDGPLNVGTIFTVTANNRITAGRYWKYSSANDGLSFTMALYGSGSTPLAQATRVQKASDPIGWVTVPFTTPVSVSPSTSYTIAYRVPAQAYFVTSLYPVLTGFRRDPFVLTPRFSTYDYSSTLAKPTGPGDYVYAVDAVAETAVSTTHRSVLALDTDAWELTQEWFDARYAEGVRLFATDGTPWNIAGDATENRPREIVESQFGMALHSGMKIALYSRNPEHYNAALDAAGAHINQLQFFALDVEEDPGIPVTQAMIDGVKARGVRPIIYGGYWTWDAIQGSTANAFSSYPLWDTNINQELDYNIWKNNPDHLAGPPKPYGGWNVAGNYRVGSQQKFDVILDGVNVDLNSFDEAFLLDLDSATISPDQTVNSWDRVTLTATGSGTWSQISGTPQAFTVSGTTLTFTATPSMVNQTLVFGYGGKTSTVTVLKSKHGLVTAGGKVTPVRLSRKQ